MKEFHTFGIPALSLRQTAYAGLKDSGNEISLFQKGFKPTGCSPKGPPTANHLSQRKAHPIRFLL